MSADLSEDERAVVELLRTRGLSIKNMDEEQKEVIRKFINRLHHEKGVSLSDIAKIIGNKTSGYTSWLTRQLGITPRPFEEARLKAIKEKRRKYPRTPFDGTVEDRAYFLGLTHGDLTAYHQWRGSITVGMSTTHPALAALFTKLFSPYGHVYAHPRFKKDTQSYEWNFHTILDESFNFLKEGPEACRDWVFRTESTLLGYPAGFLDADGSVSIYSSKGRTTLMLAYFNTDLLLLETAKRGLGLLGYQIRGPTLSKRKGTKTKRYGIERKKDYWMIGIQSFARCQELLRRLPLRHAEKVSKKELAMAPSSRDSWSWVGPKMEEIRQKIKKDRDMYVAEAERIYLENHPNH
ncbi:MAG: hypothetical protein OK422_00980 [Thaumarchaeota archaeon]|nr:hypothetical protein [Nitrososphaerota archaeon]